MHGPSTLSLALLLLSACSAAPSPQDDAARASLEAGATALAPAELDALVEEARGLLEGGAPYEALAVLDPVHKARPDDAGAWYLRGKLALAAAELGQSAGDFYTDAQGFFERAAALGAGPDALFGASRAARMNLAGEVALEHARAGMDAFEAAAPRPSLEQPAERILVEALFDAYVARKQAGEDAIDLYGEIEDRLARRTIAEPEDAWTWTQLSNLYQWEGQGLEALSAFERVLALSPDDQAVHERLVGLARGAGGSPAVLAAYERFNARHADSALGAWFPAVETFNAAVADLKADNESIPGFEAAEALFQRCRGLEAAYEASCKGYEVMCRDGVAWARYGKGDLEGAKRAFLSMEEVLVGGLDWQIEGSLLSGVMGLQFVADRYARKSKSEFDLEGKPEAAAVFDLLREHKPDNADFANNAGFFHRDACVIFELEAEDLLKQAEGWQLDERGRAVVDEEGRPRRVERSPEEVARLRAQAAQKRAQAEHHAQRSYLAYQAAVELSPEDVRVLNDAALVMVYHIRKDVDEMTGLLERAIALGAEQIQDPELSADDLDALLEAWGDAHQNMGLVHLTLLDDPAGARAWFERSFEIGPRPRVGREWVERVALAACAAAERGEPDALEGLDFRLWLHVRP